MTDKQIKLYRVEWNLARKALRELGRSPKEADAERHAIHLRVMGEDKSSLELTNRELDLVLGAFRALSRPAQLGPQLDEAEQPLKRMRYVIAELCGKLGRDIDYAQAVAVSMNREGKLGKRGVFELDELEPEELTKIIVALRKQVAREAGKKTADDTDGADLQSAECPF